MSKSMNVRHSLERHCFFEFPGCALPFVSIEIIELLWIALLQHCREFLKFKSNAFSRSVLWFVQNHRSWSMAISKPIANEDWYVVNTEQLVASRFWFEKFSKTAMLNVIFACLRLDSYERTQKWPFLSLGVTFSYDLENFGLSYLEQGLIAWLDTSGTAAGNLYLKACEVTKKWRWSNFVEFRMYGSSDFRRSIKIWEDVR